MPKQKTRTVRGFRLKVIMVNGEERYTNLKYSSEEAMRKSLVALGGQRGYPGIAKVLSFEPHSWEEPVYELGLFTKHFSL